MRGRPSRDRGFALLVVVFLLFAVGVAGTAAYQVVLVEHRLSGFSTDAERARIIAEAGLNRFFGEAVSGMPDSVEYFIDGGEAQVSARRVLFLGPWAERYRIHSVGRVTDPRFFQSPAIREVSRYGHLGAPPFNVLAPLVTTAQQVAVGSNFTVDGEDDAPSGGVSSCRQSQAGWEPEYDLVAGGPVSGAGSVGLVTPSPTPTPAQVLSMLGAPAWSRLTDPGYPAFCEGPPGGCAAPPSGEWGVYRVTGNFTASSTQSGEGVLIVTGTIGFQSGFEWDGIILSGETPGTVDANNMEVRGLVVTGLGASTPMLDLVRGSFEFHSCNVARAGRAMGILNPEGRSYWSAF